MSSKPMPDATALKRRTIHEYMYFMTYQTRWNDNDQYSHLNNSVYNLLFDTIINKYLVEECGLQASSDSSTVPLVPPSASASSTAPSSPIALVIESHASFFRPLSFPSQILLGLSVKNIGKSSVTYEVGVFGPLRAKAQSHRHSTPSTCSDVHASSCEFNVISSPIRFTGTSSCAGDEYNIGTSASQSENIGVDRTAYDPKLWGRLLNDSGRSPAVVGGFTHVFVDREHRRPVSGLPASIKGGLDRISNHSFSQAKL